MPMAMKRPFSALIVCLVSLMLVGFGVLRGAYRGWHQEANTIEKLFYQDNGLNEAISYRAYDAANLEKVARRFLGEADAVITELADCRAGLSDTQSPLLDRYRHNERLSAAARAVKAALERTEAYRASGRDRGYVDSLIGNMDYYASSGAADAYNEAARDYNKRLRNTLSGVAASKLFVCSAQVFSSEEYTYDSPLWGFSSLPSLPARKADIRIPSMGGVISGDAIRFSTASYDALSEMNRLLSQKSPYRVMVAVTRFLDGEDVRVYGNTLFEAWGLGPHDILFVAAVGENAFYTAVGGDLRARFSEESRGEMLTDEWRAFYDAADYDGMLGCYARELAGRLTMVSGRNMEDCLPRMYVINAAVPPAQVLEPAEPEIPPVPTDPPTPARVPVVPEPLKSTQDLLKYADRTYGVNFGNLMLLVLILYLVFRSATRRGGRRRHKKRGCGCFPFSRLLG